MKYLKTFENKYEDNDFDFITKLEYSDVDFDLEEIDGEKYNSDKFDIYKATATINWSIDFEWFTNPKDRKIGEGLNLSINVKSVEFNFIYNIIDENTDIIEPDKELTKIYTPDNIKIYIEHVHEINKYNLRIMPEYIYLSENKNKSHIDIDF